MPLPRGARLAAVLWIAFALVAWNVAFDRVIVVAGRNYTKAAAAADRHGAPAVLIKDWMPAAADRAFSIATAVGGTIALVGLGSLAWAVRSASSSAVSSDRDSSAEEIACAPPPTR